jgi:hypothetical protein
MPLPLGLLLGWVIGLGFAWAAREERTDEPASAGHLLFSRPFSVAAAFASLVYAPILGYFAAFHGDWSYLYLVPWHRVPSAVDLILVLAATATVPAGFAVGYGPSRAGRRSLVMRLGSGPAAVALVLGAVCARRLAVSASYAQYHGAFGTEPITQAALGRGVLLSAIALGAGIAWSVRALRS